MPLSSVGKVEHKAGRLGKIHIKQMFVCHCADATSLNVSVIRLTQSETPLPPATKQKQQQWQQHRRTVITLLLRLQAKTHTNGFIHPPWLRWKKMKRNAGVAHFSVTLWGFYIEIPSNNDEISLPPRWPFKWEMWLFFV